MNVALVPVRSISGSKNRLASVLTPPEREALALAMLEDMVSALLAADRVDRVVVVSSDAGLLAHARSLGAQVLEEGAPAGLNAAVAVAAQTLEDEGATTLLTIPGDVPLLDPAEVDAIFDADPSRYPVVLAPSSSVTGTNGLRTTPPTAIEFRFEGASLAAHRSAAREAEVELLLLGLPSFAVDVDTPGDLLELLDEPATDHSQENRSRTHDLASGWRAKLEESLKSEKPA